MNNLYWSSWCRFSLGAFLARILPGKLRGPAAILFISRDAFSDNIAFFFVLVFLWYHTSIARYVAKWGIALLSVCRRRQQGGGIAPCWGIAGMAEKVSRDRVSQRNYRNIARYVATKLGRSGVAREKKRKKGCATKGGLWGNENRPEILTVCPKFFFSPCGGSWTSARSGRGCLHPKAYFQGFWGPARSF